MIVVDTSAILAYMNAADTHHHVVSEWLEAQADDLTTTPLVLAELDHLVAARGGAAAQRALHADLVAGAYGVEWWPGVIGAAVRIAERYADSGLGLTDASLIALAERLRTIEVATLDERHFRAVRPLVGGAAFRLLPFDR